MGAFLIRGFTPGEIIAQYLGKQTGPTKGKDGNVHMGDLKRGMIGFVSHLADNLPVAAGAASHSRSGEGARGLCGTGDGGTGQGISRAMNFAAVRKLPVVYFCEQSIRLLDAGLLSNGDHGCGNERKPGMPEKLWMQRRRRCLPRLPSRHRFRPGPARARRFSKFKTMRMHGHSEHDAAMSRAELLEEWKAKDPILRAERLLMTLGYADESYFRDVGERAKKRSRQERVRGTESVSEGRETLVGVFASLDEVSARDHTHHPGSHHVDAISQALDEEMSQDERVFLMGKTSASTAGRSR